MVFRMLLRMRIMQPFADVSSLAGSSANGKVCRNPCAVKFPGRQRDPDTSRCHFASTHFHRKKHNFLAEASQPACQETLAAKLAGGQERCPRV